MTADTTAPSITGILGAIEGLAPERSGAFVVATADGRPFGAVLADGFRVCWAVVAGQNRRLRDLLQLPAETPFDPRELTRAALKQHTIESLVRMDGCVGTVRWIAHRRDGYRRATPSASPRSSPASARSSTPPRPPRSSPPAISTRSSRPARSAPASRSATTTMPSWCARSAASG